jgi:ketosteroid isomerase-like protein
MTSDNATRSGRARSSGSGDPEFHAYLADLDSAQDDFAHGRPEKFKALWSHTDDVTLAGGLGGVIEVGWDKVAARLDWASKSYQEGDRSNELFSSFVDDDFAYVVRKEIIEARIGGEAARSRQELRVTMVFRRGADGWRMVHRHADSQTAAGLPR